MASYEARLTNSFPVTQDVVSANLVKAERRIVSSSLSRILRDTAGAIDRRLMWVLEILAVSGLGVCLDLMPRVQKGPAEIALAIAATYFTVSSCLGAYLLKVNLSDRGSSASHPNA